MKALAVLFLIAISSCEIHNAEKPDALVPATSNQDPQLPQLTIEVAGHTRSIHLQTFGDTANPPLFVLHGGPGADFRLLLPLQALSDLIFM